MPYAPNVYNEKADTAIAVDPVTLKIMWKFTLPTVIDGYQHYAHTILIDRVILAAAKPGHKEIQLSCLELYDGKLLWQKDVSAHEETLNDDSWWSNIRINARGVAIDYFPAVNTKNGKNCWASVSSTTGEVTEKISANSWWKIFWHPKGRAMPLYPDEDIAAIKTPKSRIDIAGELWPGGPYLCIKGRNIFYIIDRNTYKTLCLSPIGLQALYDSQWYASIEGNYLHCYTYTDERYADHLIFHLPTFLRAIDWTEELEAKYRAK